MATRWYGLLALVILSVACSNEDQAQQHMALAQCQANADSLREAGNRSVLLQAERDELQAALERVTRELVEVKVERDKMVVELRAYKRLHGGNGKTITQDVMK